MLQSSLRRVSLVPILFCSIVLICSMVPAFSQSQIATDFTGGGQAHSEMQPFVVVNWAVATQPLSSNDATDGFSPDPTLSNRILGEVRAFATSREQLSGEPREQFLPGGWTLADGRVLEISGNQELFGVLGATYGGDGVTTFALPDLRGRTPIGVGAGNSVSPVLLGETRGEESIVLMAKQMPSHSHTVDAVATPAAGSGENHANGMPTLGLRCIISTFGQFPSQSKPQSTDQQSPISASQRFWGEIRWYAGTSVDLAPWRECNGDLIPIGSNTGLFALLGTDYGGDGENNFGLPDARGRVLVHRGSGTIAGSVGGTETSALAVANLPSHTHRVISGGPTGETSSVGSNTGHSNLQPFLVVPHLISLQGAFPSTGAADSDVLAELSMVGFRFTPRGFAALEGQLFQTSSFSALFSLLLIEFGGDPLQFSSFALPDARDRVLVGAGQGPGLSDRVFAAEGGEFTHSLSIAEMPSHRHGEDSTTCFTIVTASGKVVTPCL